MRREKGFTLIEILLVVVIMGIMLAVIVPRAWRANIDSKYGLCRQAGSELASFAQEWAEGQIEAQVEDAEATVNAYFETLCGGAVSPSLIWVGQTAAGNWNNNGALINVTGRGIAGADGPPEIDVEGIVPPEKHPRNPFNGASYFTTANDASAGVIPGALASSFALDDQGWNYFAFRYLGTDSTDFTSAGFHAGQAGNDIENLRNGIFMARSR